jgi:hypothetical protein
MSDHVLNDSMQLRLALAIVCGTCGATAAILLLLLRTIYVQRLQEAAQWR